MAKAIERDSGGLSLFSCPIYWLPIMRLQHLKSQNFPRPVLQQLMNRHKITERLRHLLAFDLQEAVVHPVSRHHRRVKGAARLGDFVLVVREDEIDAAAVDVERLAEMLP